MLVAVKEYEPDTGIVEIRMPPTFTDEGLRAAEAIHAEHRGRVDVRLATVRGNDIRRALVADGHRKWGHRTRTNPRFCTGDPADYDEASCLVKLAGTNPTERSSGEREAAGCIHRRGRPVLRYVAYQAAVCLVRHEPEFQRRFGELTDKRRAHRLTAKQAHVALANKLLRTLWSMATSGHGYEPAIARGEVRPLPIAA